MSSEPKPVTLDPSEVHAEVEELGATLPHGQLATNAVQNLARVEIAPLGAVPSEPARVDPAPRSLTGDRYEVKRTLGVGGMGEVLLCRDAWLGRDVAMKVMRVAEGSEGRGRFVREARVQGQLEHPSIVPVYDIAPSTEGGASAPYFTMKRIQGTTLREIFERLAQGDEAAKQQFSRRKLLSALAQACLAVGFAHKRGVLHRDLKPENMMLGEFGEVYVLDWGVARQAAVPDQTPASLTHLPAVQDGLPTTQAGSLVGTPGYMSPEQASGEVDALTPRSDVYALGCILFELLTQRALHEGTSVPALIASALTRIAPKPSQLVRGGELEVPPELDAICARALALDPSERFASARELADALEAFLDGERDAALRKDLAASHLQLARNELEAAALGGDDAARARGMRELGRALALDPMSEEAMQLVTSVVVAAPNELPPAAQAALKAVELRDRAASARRAFLGYVMWTVFGPLLWWCGVKSVALELALDAALVAVALYTYWMCSTGNVQPKYMRISLLASFGLVSLLSAVCGPLFLVPGAACVVAATFLVSLRANKLTRIYITVLSLAAVLVPATLEWTGLAPRSAVFQDGVIQIVPRLAFFPAIPAQVFLTIVAVVMILNTVMLVGSSVDALVVAERKNFATAYRLSQLLPVDQKG